MFPWEWEMQVYYYGKEWHWNTVHQSLFSFKYRPWNLDLDCRSERTELNLDRNGRNPFERERNGIDLNRTESIWTGRNRFERVLWSTSKVQNPIKPGSWRAKTPETSRSHQVTKKDNKKKIVSRPEKWMCGRRERNFVISARSSWPQLRYVVSKMGWITKDRLCDILYMAPNPLYHTISHITETAGARARSALNRLGQR